MMINGEMLTMEPRVVGGRDLIPFARMAGRTAYLVTSQGVAYRITPDSASTYLLRRPSDGYTGVFASVEEAVAQIDEIERQGE